MLVAPKRILDLETKRFSERKRKADDPRALSRIAQTWRRSQSGAETMKTNCEALTLELCP